MNESKRSFWTVICFWLVGLFITLLIGCYPNKPPVARRHCGTITAGSVNTPIHGTAGQYGCYSFADGGSKGNPMLRYWILSSDFSGEPFRVGGMKVDTHAANESLDIPPGGGMASVKCPKKTYTNATGYAICDVTADSGDTYDAPYYGLSFSFVAGLPRAGEFSVQSCFSRYGINTGFIVWQPGIGERGEFWASVSDGSNSRTLAQVSPSPRREIGTATVRLSGDESTFLSGNAEVPVLSPVLVSSAKWYSPSFQDGTYLMNPASDFVILNNNDIEAVRDYSTPYTVSYCFSTFEPTILSGATFKAKAYIGEPNDPNYVCDIDISVVADSNNLSNHIARSQYILPVEPNGFSPYCVESDCGDILVVPLSEGQTIRVEIEDYRQFIIQVSPKWLMPCVALDKNRDGIFNYMDF